MLVNLLRQTIIVKFGGINDNNNNTLIIPNIVFGQATTIDKHTGNEPIDGIIGLAFQSIAINNIEPPLSAAFRLLSKPIFTVFLTTLNNNNQKKLIKGGGGGQLTYGGYDNINCGKIIGWTPLINNSYYIFEIEEINYYNNNYISKAKQKVISDTATSLIYGNNSIILSIGKQIGAEYNKSQNLLFIPCNKTYNSITFKINGIKYNLTKVILLFKIKLLKNKKDVLTIDIYDPLNKKCLFGMVPQNLTNKNFDWIFGAPFIRQYCIN
ncbi:Peptidase A1 domain-containing protein [Meloidogyne graminicola]|uniref:Peptidase A1 domain-containing protein n=1 Tax=Meloidogyne graminicola TaxID=189291 RepID=A0A8S9ZJT2_9BILA|nr:Peptidase A1 domain-containing protein [Meloidogyne graminicola]